MRRLLRPFIPAAIAFGIVLSAGPGHADTAAAEALFRDAQKLMTEGDYARACPKFAESHRQDPSSGTLLNLADCYERQGRTASAWAQFLAAASLSSARGDAARLKEAQRRAGELEPKLSYVKIEAPAGIPGLVVHRDGEPVSEAAFGTSLPIDPGNHEITAEAPGYRRWQATLTIEKSGDTKTVTIPTLERASAAPAASTSPAGAAPASTGSTAPVAQHATSSAIPTGTYVAGGIALGAVAVGGVFGVMALSTYNDAESKCPSHARCSQDAMDTRSRAETQAWIANLGIGVGVGAAAVAAVLLFTRSGGESRPKPISIDAAAGPSGASLGIRGSF